MSKLSYREIKAKEKEFLALTSLTVSEFEILVPHFEQAFQNYMAEWRLDGKRRTKRSYTTYKNCPLPTPEDRLLFGISYMKSNPLQSNHGLLFAMAQCKVNSWLHILLPVLRNTLRGLGVAPSRSVSELAERLELSLEFEGDLAPASEAALPLFARMGQNGALSVRKRIANSVRVIAARNIPIP
jgi:hypothetical protein